LNILQQTIINHSKKYRYILLILSLEIIFVRLTIITNFTRKQFTVSLSYIFNKINKLNQCIKQIKIIYTYIYN